MNCPTPSPEALIRSEQLCHQIRSEIEHAQGQISFARFMEQALYAPRLGYYSSEQAKIGQSGDYVTAPEISYLFAKSLSVQCRQILEILGGGDILECGAGTGVLAKDLLLELEQANALPDTYYILEISADLRQRQADCLKTHCPHLYPRVQWLDTLVDIKGIILANEVMDAFPFHCFTVDSQSIKERCVTWENGFRWVLSEANDAIKTALVGLQFSEGYCSEVNLQLPTWIASTSAHLTQGVMLLLDYGYGSRAYYHPDRNQGTLMCYYQHRHHDDPFFLVGLQDITASVNFTAVVESAYDAGCLLGGFTTQAGFLLSSGILDHIGKAPDLLQGLRESQAVKLLMLPSQMGESIKVMALCKEFTAELCGFRFQDRQIDL